jgi:copper chaperone CopZ
MEGGLVEQRRYVSPDIKGDGDRDRLETDLAAIDGVRDVEVDPNRHSVTVTYNPDVVDPNLIQQTVEDAGYKVESQEAGTSTGGGASPA